MSTNNIITHKTDAGTARYPRVAYAFNPISVEVELSDEIKEGEIEFHTIDKHGEAIYIERTVTKGKSRAFRFDISAIARSFFDRREFHKVEKEDKVLMKTFNFSIFLKIVGEDKNGKNEVIHTSLFDEEPITILWGALQFGEQEAKVKKLTHFRGYPFTYPCLLQTKIVEEVCEPKNGIYASIREHMNEIMIIEDNTGYHTVETIDLTKEVDLIAIKVPFIGNSIIPIVLYNAEGGIEYSADASTSIIDESLEEYYTMDIDSSATKAQLCVVTNKSDKGGYGTRYIKIYKKNGCLQERKDYGFWGNEIEYKPGKYNIQLTDDQKTAQSLLRFREMESRGGSVFTEQFDDSFHGNRFFIPRGKEIHIKMVEESCDDTVYLRWINKLGEYNYYLFHNKPVSSAVKDERTELDNIYHSIDFSGGYHAGATSSIGKTVEQSQKLYVPMIDRDTYDFLLQMVESPVVDMLVDYKRAGGIENWLSVDTKAGTFGRSSAHLQDFDCELILQPKQVQHL